ncbi:MAG: peptide-methionine (S)-S-oxide reductase MsrA [Bacteroidaceae bacterium]|nr:peptide-methionine (S)-S-oxide reductase MsrA [Bacteroidaceae bacterium]
MKKNAVIFLAGGCFWGTEHYLKMINGIIKTEVGFANGTTENPSYRDVCDKNTGHAETVKVTYDPKTVTLRNLLNIFFKAIDPTSINKQGGDEGTQYRTGIYYTEEADVPVIKEAINDLFTHYKKPIATEVLPLENFYTAEEYHQNYLFKNPTGYCHLPQALFDYAKKANR